MASNAIDSDFRSSKKIQKKNAAYWSEMARNAIENDFRSSKVVTGSHCIVLRIFPPLCSGATAIKLITCIYIYYHSLNVLRPHTAHYVQLSHFIIYFSPSIKCLSRGRVWNIGAEIPWRWSLHARVFFVVSGFFLLPPSMSG